MYFRIVLLFLMIHIAGSSSYSQNPAKTPVKRYHFNPVYLNFSGLPLDSSINAMVYEAFTRHKVDIVSEKKFNELNEDEVRRVEAKFTVRNDQFTSEDQVRKAIAAEQRFVVNELLIDFKTNGPEDSLVVTAAEWEAIPSPPEINSPKSSGRITSSLKDTCCSMRDNIFALVDMILSSRWLK